MKPVLIQHLIKHNKGKYKAEPISQSEQRHNDRTASLVLWFLVIIVLIGLFAN